MYAIVLLAPAHPALHGAEPPEELLRAAGGLHCGGTFKLGPFAPIHPAADLIMSGNPSVDYLGGTGAPPWDPDQRGLWCYKICMTVCVAEHRRGSEEDHAEAISSGVGKWVTLVGPAYYACIREDKRVHAWEEYRMVSARHRGRNSIISRALNPTSPRGQGLKMPELSWKPVAAVRLSPGELASLKRTLAHERPECEREEVVVRVP